MSRACLDFAGLPHPWTGTRGTMCTAISVSDLPTQAQTQPQAPHFAVTRIAALGAARPSWTPPRPPRAARRRQRRTRPQTWQAHTRQTCLKLFLQEQNAHICSPALSQAVLLERNSLAADSPSGARPVPSGIAVRAEIRPTRRSRACRRQHARARVCCFLAGAPCCMVLMTHERRT